MRLSIRWKFILSIGITLLVTYPGLLTWDYWWQRESASQNMQQLVAGRAEARARGLDRPLEAVSQIVDAVAAGVSQDMSPETVAGTVERVLRSRQGGNAQVVVIVLPPAATEGVAEQPVVAVKMIQQGGRGVGGRGGRGGRGGGNPGPGRSDGRGGDGRESQIQPLAERDYAQAPFYLTASQQPRAVWLGPHVEPVFHDRQPVLTYTAPLMSGETFRGIVCAALTQQALPGVRAGRGFPSGAPDPGQPPDMDPQEVGPGRGATGGGPGSTSPPAADSSGMQREHTILDSTGTIIAPFEVATATGNARSLVTWAQSNDRPELAAQLTAVLSPDNTAVKVVRVHDVPGLVPNAEEGQYYWVALAPVSAADWVVATAISESQYMGPIIQRLFQRALFLVSGLVVLLIVTTLVSIRISRPIERLAAAVDQLAEGDLAAQVRGVHSRDELGQLARAFNTMTGQLRSHVAALTEQTAAREIVEAELRIARQIQTDLLPRKFPPFPGRTEFELFAVNVPAHRVAGDFFDFFFAPNDLLTIAIADVSGKGMPAALLMAVTRTIIRNLAMEGLSPGQIVERANAMLIEDISDSMFVTMFLMQYDTRTGRIVYVNAGHPRPYRIAPTGKPRQFGEVTGALLGVNPVSLDWAYEQHEDHLDIGETLMLYTDGVTEARAPDGSMLRNEGTETLLAMRRGQTVRELCEGMVEELNRFQHGQPADDITMVALRRVS